MKNDDFQLLPPPPPGPLDLAMLDWEPRPLAPGDPGPSDAELAQAIAYWNRREVDGDLVRCAACQEWFPRAEDTDLDNPPVCGYDRASTEATLRSKGLL